MADITMCLDKRCPSRTMCRRFMAIPSALHQSYSDFKRHPNKVRCSMFLDNKKQTKRVLVGR